MSFSSPGVFQALIGSANFRFYRQVALLRASKIVLFYFLVTFIYVSLMSVILMPRAMKAYREFVYDVPEIRLEDGKISTVPPTLFKKELPQLDLVMVIDGSGQAKWEEFDQSKSILLLSGTKFVFRQMTPRGLVKSQEGDLSQSEDFTLDKEFWDRFGSMAMWKIIPAIFLVYNLVGKILYVLILSLLGLIARAVLKKDLRYGNLLKIGILALVPAMLIQLVMLALGATVPYVYGLVYLVYLVVGIYLQPGETQVVSKQ